MCNIDFLVTWCHWSCYKCHMLPTVSSILSFHLLGQDDQKEMQNNFLAMWCQLHHQWYHCMCLVNIIKMRCNMTFLVMGCHWYQHFMIPMALSMVHDTHASTSTSTGTKSHIIPLTNHLNKRNVMVWLMGTSASHDRKHAIAMYMPKTNMPLKCHIYSTCSN